MDKIAIRRDTEAAESMATPAELDIRRQYTEQLKELEESQKRKDEALALSRELEILGSPMPKPKVKEGGKRRRKTRKSRRHRRKTLKYRRRRH